MNVAKGFHSEIPVSGLVFTKIDGDARGGAAISIREVTGIPIKYLGTGEGLDALEVFDPTRISCRILGMGDILGLIEKAEAAYSEGVDAKEAERMLTGNLRGRLCQTIAPDEKDGANLTAFWYAAGTARSCRKEC